MAPDELEHPGEVEARHRDDRGAGRERREQRDDEAHHVRERHDREHRVARPVADAGADLARGGDEVAVGEHHALGQPGRAAGVGQQGERRHRTAGGRARHARGVRGLARRRARAAPRRRPAAARVSASPAVAVGGMPVTAAPAAIAPSAVTAQPGAFAAHKPTTPPPAPRAARSRAAAATPLLERGLAHRRAARAVHERQALGGCPRISSGTVRSSGASGGQGLVQITVPPPFTRVKGYAPL